MMLPVAYPVRQLFPTDRLDDVAAKVREEMEKALFLKGMAQGARIAVTAGSRGISNIALILKTVCDVLRENGADPFLLPSMGSHGGGTAEGQRTVLAGLGITEDTVGVPIQATAESLVIGETEQGVAVYQNRIAKESDGIIVINRVKAHTSFQSHVESGLCKMMAVGLGNPAGAQNLHSYGVEGLRTLIAPISQVMVEKSPVAYGLAIIENAYEQTADIVGLEPTAILQEEPNLLRRSKELIPKLPFENIDILIVEEIGKCFSGTCMDTNVIGRLRIEGEPEPATPTIGRIIALDLADASHGNANGIGLADFTTQKLLGKIDWKATYMNNLSSTFVKRAFVPIVMETAEEAFSQAVRTLGHKDATDLRIVKIKNTLHLDHLWVSRTMLPEVTGNPKLQLLGEGVSLI